MKVDEKQRKEQNGKIYEVSNIERGKKNLKVYQEGTCRFQEKIGNMQNLLTFSFSAQDDFFF